MTDHVSMPVCMQASQPAHAGQAWAPPPVNLVELSHDTTTGVRRYHRPLLTYHLFFSVLALAVLAPASAWLLSTVLSTTGHPMVSDEDIVRFVLSPSGALWLLAAGTLGWSVVYLEHAGMMVVAADPSAGRYRAVTAALWQVGRLLPRLAGLACVVVAAHLAVALPFLTGVVGSYLLVLGDYDPYYVVAERPGVVWLFLALAAPFVVGAAIIHGCLYVRWILALPAVLFEQCTPRAALRRSAALTAGNRLHIAGVVLGMALLVTSLPLLLSLVFDGLGRIALGPLPERHAILIPGIVLYLALYTALAFLVTFLAVGLNSMMVYKLYLRAIGRPPVAPRSVPPRGTGLLAWTTELAILLFALVHGGWVLSTLQLHDDVIVTAHRGSSMTAPENTLSAIEQALRDGADFVEIDVRETADGVLVLLHDRDLRRVAGDRRAVWQFEYHELRQLDVGSWFSPAFAGERIPTLAQAVEAVRGRAQLYVEIKPAVQTPRLTRNVIDALRALAFLDAAVIASLDQATIREVQRLAPEARAALLVHSVIGDIDRTGLHALGLRAALITPAEVVAARSHGHELHAWTVNRPAQMSRLIDLGVDGIITDRPDVLAALLTERAQLSHGERLLLRIRNWLWQ
jgi:glycerophosphoryl diester phosphodiesterase